MNLEQAIHERWQAAVGLEALLPAQRLKTGRSPGDPMPYATLNRLRNRTALRTNAGEAVDQCTVQIDVWCEEFDAGQAIIRQVKAAFDRSAFDISGDDRVVQMRRTGETSSQDADGVWRFSIQFQVHVYLPSGF